MARKFSDNTREPKERDSTVKSLTKALDMLN
jgi:hypothetical protein